MEKQMEIKSLKVKNFGCIQDLDIKLTPLHAVIGPNDSGKSTLLRAVRTGMQLLADRFYSLETKCNPFDPGLHNDALLLFSCAIGNEWQFNYELSIKKFDLTDQWRLAGEKINELYANKDIRLIKDGYEKSRRSLWNPNNAMHELLKWIEVSPKLPRMVRLDPDSLRKPGGLIPSSDPINLQENGVGLVSVLDALISRNLNGYLEIREQFQKLFPTVVDLNYQNISNTEKKLGIKLINGKQVFSEFLSEGMLYYLAYKVQQYLEPASILLIEEPENGLHPSRIKEIMSIIRELSKTTQVLIATHSPLVINEMKPEEVTILWRDDEKGTQAIPMLETTNFQERNKVYALGELWLSYADGVSEKKLRPSDK